MFWIVVHFQFCQKGFRQPQSLNFHLKAKHKVDIPLSQGQEERYLRLKTRAAMRNLAAMDTWTTGRLEQDRGGATPHTTEVSSTFAGDKALLLGLCLWLGAGIACWQRVGLTVLLDAASWIRSSSENFSVEGIFP